MRAQGFVYLEEVDSTIRTSLRYATDENFLGHPVAGYKSQEHVIVTYPTALALKKVQEEVQKDGYCLVVYDAYRPQQAVDSFMEWSTNLTAQSKKSFYYPRVNKEDVFDLGYVAKRSGHSRGSTVDLTIIENNKEIHPVIASVRVLKDGFSILFLDDGTVDMGSSFDLFDIASHYENDLIPAEYKIMRKYLHNVMIKHGLKGIAEEWWHFTLENEPFPTNYFNFPVQ
jgi:D-alanyl-D-alanine dipeptidase